MNRLTDHETGAALSEALRLIPAPIRERVAGVELFTEDPTLALPSLYEKWEKPRYSSSAHYLCPELAPDDRPTIVLGKRRLGYRRRPQHLVVTMVHEIGHVLEDQLHGWRSGEWLREQPPRDLHVPEPVTKYAKTAHYEAFAEAFTLWCVPELCARVVPDWKSYEPDVLAQDHETLALFEELAR